MAKYISGILLLLFLGIGSNVRSQILKNHRDSIDNAIDLSKFLSELHGVLPIISPITEPAVGYGLAGAGLYFITKDNNGVKTYKKPDVVGVGGGFTQNGTWFAGGGYFGFWKNDRLRYRGAMGYGDINLTYYRPESSLIPKKSEGFNITGFLFLQQAVLRMPESNFFVGAKYQLAHINVNFLKDADIPDIDPKDFEMWNSGISLITEYENFDNIFSPTKGMRIHLSYDQNLEILGSDRNWGTVNFFSYFYFPVTKVWMPALRVASRMATGNTPFYAKPFIELRGIPAMRYLGDITAILETEQMLNINGRWSLVGFGGIGNTFREKNNFKADKLVWNAGGGFRYMIARLFGLKMGMDIARGPEDWAVYIVFGSSWLK